MKKASLVAASIAGGAVLVGGGAWAATTLPASTQETVSATPAPTDTPTVEVTPTVDPTSTTEPVAEPTPTASAVPDETSAPETPAQSFIDRIRPDVEFYEFSATDEEYLAALEYTCAEIAAGETGIVVFPENEVASSTFVALVARDYC